MTGLLLAGLSRHADPSGVPPALVPALQHCIRHESAVELSREIELEHVLSLLAQAGLNPLIIKGTALAYTLYDAPHLRSRCDTDLLFPDRASAEQAWKVLERMGYHRPAMRGEFISHEFGCHRTDRLKVGHVLDIHWKFSNSPIFANTLTFQELAAAAEHIPALSPHARGLGPAHAMLLACMHRIAHIKGGVGNRLIWLYDIHLLTGRFTPADWAQFANTATRFGLCGICLDGLMITQCQFSTAIPRHSVDTLRTGSASEWLTPKLVANDIGQLYADIRSLPTWQGRMLLLRDKLFPDADYMMEQYQTTHAWRLPLLYLHRLFNEILKRIR